MKYIVYNADKDVRLPDEFEYRDALFTKSSLGRILMMLLDKEWSGDRIAILPTDKWDADSESLKKAGILHNPMDAKAQNIVFDTTAGKTKKYIEAEDSFIRYNKGAFYEYTPDKEIKRFNTLIPLITIDPPPELMDGVNPEINGGWCFVPLKTTADKPKKKDLSNCYDIESFYRNDTDKKVRKTFENIEDSPLWAGDLVGEGEDG